MRPEKIYEHIERTYAISRNFYHVLQLSEIVWSIIILSLSRHMCYDWSI